MPSLKALPTSLFPRRHAVFLREVHSLLEAPIFFVSFLFLPPLHFTSHTLTTYHILLTDGLDGCLLFSLSFPLPLLHCACEESRGA